VGLAGHTVISGTPIGNQSLAIGIGSSLKEGQKSLESGHGRSREKLKSTANFFEG
jgi:hypothetical protein